MCSKYSCYHRAILINSSEATSSSSPKHCYLKTQYLTGANFEYWNTFKIGYNSYQSSCLKEFQRILLAVLLKLSSPNCAINRHDHPAINLIACWFFFYPCICKTPQKCTAGNLQLLSHSIRIFSLTSDLSAGIVYSILSYSLLRC